MNTDLAKRVLKEIENDPALFDMNEYGRRTPCGTAACIAGHALLISGYRFQPTYGDRGHYRDPVTGYSVSAYHSARKLLGLTDGEAKGLFFITGNDVARIRLRELIEQSET